VTPLRANDLVKNFGTLCAVDHLSFEVEEGEIFGLLGPNGAGKTTFISMVTTLEEPTSGEIEIFGHSVLKEPQVTASLMGVVPQELVSSGYFTVEELLDFHSGLYGVRNNQGWIDHILERLGLSAQRSSMCRMLSGGMKRRLLIAKALVHKPKLILLDEPTAGVDIDLRADLWDFILDLNRGGATILLTTHYLEEAEQLCDRVGIIDRGRLRKVGGTKELISELTTREMTLYFTTDIPPLTSPYLIEQSGQTALFYLPHNVDFRTLIESLPIGADLVADVEVRDGTLEDAVRHIIGSQQEKR